MVDDPTEDVPVPVNVITLGVALSFDAMLSVPERAPEEPGVNASVIVQVPLTAIGEAEMQLFVPVIEKSPEFVPPIVRLEMVSVLTPVFVTVTEEPEDATPTA